MPTPVVSLRASPKDADLLRRAARALKADHAVAARIEAAIAGRAMPGGGGLHNYGPFGDEATALAFLRDRLVAALAPLEIRLFGSRGRGEGRPDSDFDLLVVLPDGAEVDYDRAYAPLLGCGIGCDVVPCSLADWRAERDIPGTLCHAAAQGRPVYRREG
ncbi:MAG TPA: nucleotidyltransferase domain-containing protein [Candidatus Omnitrophota bacterium]|nr:nucleotidyltransferase domain-containing protein [Candidatus Omnitrophota bacterium]